MLDLSPALETVAPAISVLAYHNNEVVIEKTWGHIDPQHPVTSDTLFDLASLTKLFTTTALLTLMSQQNLSIKTPVVDLLPEFGTVNPRPMDGGQDPHSKVKLPTPEHLVGETVNPAEVTLWHLLTHTSGLPAWRDVYNQPHPLTALTHYPFTNKVGAAVCYSDIGLMLLGEITARLNQSTLEAAIQQHVLELLGVTDVMFNPLRTVDKIRIAPTELDTTWRQCRVWGEVHDENAYGLGGVAGHAGLFGTAQAVAKFGLAWLNKNTFNISTELMLQAITEQAVTHDERRGLGWMLRSKENSSAGRHMSMNAYGHTGFTGTSLWIDPDARVVVVLLTNRVYYGRDGRGIHALRQQVSDAVMEAIR
jgi:CubicO group peptidase (beta-lactamase class C family)